MQHPPHLMTTADLRRQGLTHREIQRERAAGRLRRVRRGVYALEDLADHELEHRRLIHAALTAIGPDNVVSHTSAGVLHGLPVPRKELGRVTITRRSPGHGRHDDNLVIRRTRIDDKEITSLDGVPVTALARTAADLARTSPFAWGVMACDAALRAGELTHNQLFEILARHPRLDGAARARSAIEFADPRSESPGESLSRVTMAAAGIPAPELQVELFDEAGEFVARPDFLWPDLCLVGEFDGKVKYSSLLRPGEAPEDVMMRQLRRDERLRQLGYWPMHWDYEIAGDRGALGTLIRRGMAHQSRRLRQ